MRGRNEAYAPCVDAHRARVQEPKGYALLVPEHRHAGGLRDHDVRIRGVADGKDFGTAAWHPSQSDDDEGEQRC